FSNAASEDAISKIADIKINQRIPDWNDEGTSHPEEMILITQSNKEVQQIMSKYVGIVRSNIRLNRAYDRLEVLYRETEALYQGSKVSEKICHLRNKINVGYLIIKMARKRKESRGLHFNIDFPDKLES
ncbi:MAG: L-aspartate oxidase, partial [Carboxylicivirga sp.]|nr:L-aspartate oxidase [Carboxylicivirga sp.]